MGREEILEMVKKIVLSALEEIPITVYLFGSWARGEEKRTSDIDLGFWSNTPLSPDLIPSLKSNLEESLVPYRVDLVDLTKVNRALLEKVEREGLIWKDYRKEL